MTLNTSGKTEFAFAIGSNTYHCKGTVTRFDISWESIPMFVFGSELYKEYARCGPPKIRMELIADDFLIENKVMECNLIRNKLVKDCSIDELLFAIKKKIGSETQ